MVGGVVKAGVGGIVQAEVGAGIRRKRSAKKLEYGMSGKSLESRKRRWKEGDRTEEILGR